MAAGLNLRVSIPAHPTRPAWIVPRDELVDFKHVPTIPFYPKVKQLLKTEFHRASFLPRQVAAINCAIQGFDLLLMLPTCGGKSLCYQLPAIYNQSALTIVFSPFTALIEDQIRSLHALGPQWKNWAQRSHGGHRQELVLDGLNGPRIFYICPEWLDNNEHKQTLFDLASQNKIARIVLDEAHNAIPALQNMENPYRSAFSTIFTLRNTFPRIPFTLSSASLTLRDQFRLTNALFACGRFYSVSAPSHRRNFHYRVVHLTRHRRAEQKAAIIAKYMKDRPEAKGFVFVPTRKLAQSVAEKLQEYGVQADWYHAGVSEKLPDVIQKLQSGLIPVLVCTSAFGEGVDNKLVNFVVHYSIPPSMTRYFQETGRIGRIGQDAECILLYSFSDIRPLINVVAHELPPKFNSSARERQFFLSQREDLQQVLEYCTDSFSCRHKRILALFSSHNTTDLPDIISTSTAERFEGFYLRALSHSFGPSTVRASLATAMATKADQLPATTAYQGGAVTPKLEKLATRGGIDPDCEGCDVCDRRYRPYDTEEEEEDEMSWWKDVAPIEMSGVEISFRNDTTILLSELVKRLTSLGYHGLTSRRAHDIVEFLAVVGVLRMSFEYFTTASTSGFAIKVQKGGTQLDTIHYPVPVKWKGLGAVKLPTKPRKPAKDKAPKVRRERAATELTEDTIVDASGRVYRLDSEDEWMPGPEDDASTSENESDTGETDSDESWLSTGDDQMSEDPETRATPFEDGRGIRQLRSRKRERSGSYVLPDPPPPLAQGKSRTPRSSSNDEEIYASPPKRRRIERRGVSPVQTNSDSERLLKKYLAAAKKERKDKRDDLLSVSERTLKKLFARHSDWLDKPKFSEVLRQVGATTYEITILEDWFEWIDLQVLAGRMSASFARKEAGLYH